MVVVEKFKVQTLGRIGEPDIATMVGWVVDGEEIILTEVICHIKQILVRILKALHPGIAPHDIGELETSKLTRVA